MSKITTVLSWQLQLPTSGVIRNLVVGGGLYVFSKHGWSLSNNNTLIKNLSVKTKFWERIYPPNTSLLPMNKIPITYVRCGKNYINFSCLISIKIFRYTPATNICALGEGNRQAKANYRGCKIVKSLIYNDL